MSKYSLLALGTQVYLKMKIQIIFKLCCLLCFSGTAFAQPESITGFSWHEIRIQDYAEFRQDTYYLCGSLPLKEDYTKLDSAFVMKWSPEGDSTIKSYKLHEKEWSEFRKIVKANNNQLIAFGTAKHYNTIDTGDFIAVSFDSSLNILWECNLTIPRTDIMIMDVERLPNGNWVVGMDCGNRNWAPNGQPMSQIYLLEITNEGEIDTIVVDTAGRIRDITIPPDSSRIFCLGEFGFLMPNGTECHVVFDTNYNRLPVIPLIKPYFYGGYSNVMQGIWLDNDTLLFSTEYYGGWYKYDITLQKTLVADSQIVVKSNSYTYPNKEDYANGLTITKDNRIIQVGHLDEWGQMLGWAGIYNHDIELVDHKTFPKANSVTSLVNVKSTLDSGFMFLTYQAPAINTLIDTVYIIKYGKGSNLSGVNEIKASQTANIQIFPNPGKNNIHLIMNEGLPNRQKLNFRLYNQMGMLMMESTINNEKSSINTSGLPAGIYFYEISDNGFKKYMGKWIKQ